MRLLLFVQTLSIPFSKQQQREKNVCRIRGPAADVLYLSGAKHSIGVFEDQSLYEKF